MNFRRKQRYGSHSDEQLMMLAGRGEIPAFDELYDRYSVRILRYFHRMLGGDEATAQDFLHDLFLKIVQRPDLFSQERKFSTWIFSSAHNMCKNEYRRRRIRQSEEVHAAHVVAEPEFHDDVDRQLFADVLKMELAMLDEDQRTTFLLRHQEEFSIREISDALGCPEGTVKSRLFNVARKLAVRLKEYDPSISGVHHE